MGDPVGEGAAAGKALEVVFRAAGPYLEGLAERKVHESADDGVLGDLGGPLPERGVGGERSIEQLVEVGVRAATHSSGPRFFHLVVGGATPAAMAGDWATSLLDQVSGLWLASPLAARVETVALGWLKELFGIPPEFGGVLTPSATFAHVTGLACARAWWAERHGVDVTAHGLSGLPPLPVFSSGLVHPSTRRALQVLGHGRDTLRTFARDDTGTVDLEALEAALRALDGAPAIVVGNVGEVTTGAADPLPELADLAARHGAWLHVDAAFGAFAALSPRTSHLTDGMERADSITADGHKWLNVPYESGFSFIRDPAWQHRAFGDWGVPYLPGAGEEQINYNTLGPESSRRARALPIWATLKAYGREGYQQMVERHLDVAAHLGALIDQAPDLELLAPVRLCVVCFRYRPPGVPEERLDELNTRLGEALLADGRVYAGTSMYRGRKVLRAAIVNWRTTTGDVELLLRVLHDLGPALAADLR
ncbi:aminotransferase class I/II-fold pyridoxal phosphate-dependent enzyme [Actinocorallia sp. API 0066]|uniref:pyridoxal phosphate-dependent decarboxylase family protein n=1 Tax=Actinocorallia sp. API 0066 TaxID=2896846 RepID=UPI001E503665|nr:aminotransferase class I/II-fold pyridoxal phosphate-dependent enzyme [Actinocorallia sp. API 0066]MCD0449258.1 aminotransferase class I/II-fold pyridoxal phosphate-dependent enzyme [Actinocorallia sp. API 0066]